jgi:hypothetical protein
MFSSCGKIINCTGESLLISIDITPDGDEPNLVEFQVTYSGDFELESVDYDFGDGQSAKGEGTLVAHRYATSGVFDAVIQVALKDKNRDCRAQFDRVVTVP